MTKQAALLRLAREAVNGWACYAKRDVEHREIARIHSALDDIDRHDAACETELTSHGYNAVSVRGAGRHLLLPEESCICAPTPAPEGRETSAAFRVSYRATPPAAAGERLESLSQREDRERDLETQRLEALARETAEAQFPVKRYEDAPPEMTDSEATAWASGYQHARDIGLGVLAVALRRVGGGQ